VTVPAVGEEADRRAGAGGGRDRTTLRRALLAGAVAWAAVALPLLAAVLLGGGSAQMALTGVLLGFVIGACVAAGWLLFAAVLDLWVGEPPGRRRLVWTAAMTGVALLSPLLLLAAGG
jgi:hypothetical protein